MSDCSNIFISAGPITARAPSPVSQLPSNLVTCQALCMSEWWRVRMMSPSWMGNRGTGCHSPIGGSAETELVCSPYEVPSSCGLLPLPECHPESPRGESGIFLRVITLWRVLNNSQHHETAENPALRVSTLLFLPEQYHQQMP